VLTPPPIPWPLVLGQRRQTAGSPVGVARRNAAKPLVFCFCMQGRESIDTGRFPRALVDAAMRRAIDGAAKQREATKSAVIANAAMGEIEGQH